jgi:hypothetical protein
MNSHWLRRTVMSAILLAGTSGFAAAQDTSSGSEFTSWRTPGWSFTPGVTIAGAFDSNIALASAPADTRQTQSDRLFIAQPSAQLEFVSPRTVFATGYQGYLRRYMDVDQLNGFDQRGHLSLRRLATKRVTFFLRDSYADVPTTDEVELNGVPFTRSGVRTNTAQAGIDARLTKFTDLAVRVDNAWVDFDRTDTFLTGGWVNGVRTELSHRLGVRVSVGGEYGVRFADLNEGTHQLMFQDVGGTLRYGLGGRTGLALAGGFSHLDDRSFGLTRTGPYVRAELTHDAEHATVGAAFERMFVPSFGFGGSNQSQQARGFIRMPLNRNRLYIQGSAAWRRSEPFVENELELDTFSVRSTLGYSAARWLRLEGFYAFTRQDSQVTGGEINRHRAGTQVVISQPMRIR